MRYSKNKSKSTPKGEEENERSLKMELELIGLKAKNADLIKAHTKLVQENADLRNQIYFLQAELVKAETKYNNLETYMMSLQENMKKCTPNLINILNLFLDINSKPPLKNFQHSSIASFRSPPTKSITQSVQPHTVNGTVLNLNPTITLTRLNTSNQNTIESFNNSNVHLNNTPPTSNFINNSIDNPEDRETESIENDDNIYVSNRRGNPLSTDSLSESEDEITDANQNSSDGQSVMNKLSIIPEESYYLEAKQQCRVSEVKICLSPLSRSDIENALNGSHNSTMANLDDTSLNINTNLDDENNRASKRLKADILFSPYTNSTRLECDGSFFDQSLSVQIKRLPTPSTSAMGDIDKKNYSKLEIFTDLPQNTIGISPISPISVASRKGSGLFKDQSPRSSRQNIRNRGLKSKSVLSDSDNYKSATVVLKRLENSLTDNKEDNLFDNHADDKFKRKLQKDNENKSKKEKIKSKYKSSKRKHKEELLEDKLHEIKKRLSMCMPETDLSAELPESRPKRAARPKDLKDASLKTKLRRLL
ncbi:uncharacterized protein LOC143206962 [Rhynchophorus ferrugineus]|uniref:uncharacterized protein LOC143206962 n=1 Tax=Rhynchophorus ferrugineus TaxID=354439 RepID=UPI003FCDA56B